MGLREHRQDASQQQQMGGAEKGIEGRLDTEDQVPDEIADRAQRKHADADDSEAIADRDPGIPADDVGQPAGDGQEARVEDGVPGCEKRLQSAEVAVRPTIDEEPGDQPGREKGRNQVFSDRGPLLGLRSGERRRG